MPQEKTGGNPFETYSQQERNSMGEQLAELIKQGKLTPGQKANVQKAMLLNNRASQAKGPQGPGFDEKHPFLAKDLQYEKEMLEGLGRGVKTAVTAPYELLKPTTKEEKAAGYKEGSMYSPLTPINRLANRLVRQPMTQEKQAAEASHTAAAQGEGTAGQILEYYRNMPFIGGMVQKAMEGGPHMFSPQSLGVTTEGAAYAILPEVQKGVIGELRTKAPGIAAKLRKESANLYTKSVGPSAELQKGISETDPSVIGKGLRAEGIVTRRKNYMAKLEPIVDKNVEKMRQMEAALEAKGYHMNVERHFDQTIAEALKETNNPQAKNAIQQFSDAAKYESVQDPNTGRWTVDKSKPRNLAYMTPTEIRNFMRDMDKYAYGDAASMHLLQDLAKKARGAISGEFGKNIPGYTELGKQVQGQLGALDALRESHAAEVRGAKTQVMRTVFEAGVVPIAAYEALKTLGASAGVSAGAYPTALALVKTAVSVPSRTLRAAIYNRLADLMDPQKKLGLAIQNPAPPPATPQAVGGPNPGQGPLTPAGTPFPPPRGAVPVAPAGGPANPGQAPPSGGPTPGTRWPPSKADIKAKEAVTSGANLAADRTEGAAKVKQYKARLSEEELTAKREAAKVAKKEKDAARMQEKRAMAKGEAKSAAQQALGKEGGTGSMYEAISKDFTPEQHVVFMEKAEGILKGLSSENYKVYQSIVDGPDKHVLSPADKRQFIVGLIEQSQGSK